MTTTTTTTTTTSTTTTITTTTTTTSTWTSTNYQFVPHKTVAEVSKIANYRRLVAVTDGSPSEPTDGLSSGWWRRSVIEVVVVIAVEM